jgi:RHS repeat-associated protein
VKTSGGSTIVTYKYDAITRRTSETKGSNTRDFYYTAGWQVLEEKLNGTTDISYVWSPVYVDALIVRDRDTDANGSLDERLYVLQDANFNVTALVNASGTVVERYTYDSFGSVTVYDASWNVRVSGSSYGWIYHHQGGRWDTQTGLYLFGYRDSSPTIGRWLQIDPIGFTAGDPHLWRSEGNNPPNFLDPSGLQQGQFSPRARPTITPERPVPPPLSVRDQYDPNELLFIGIAGVQLVGHIFDRYSGGMWGPSCTKTLSRRKAVHIYRYFINKF